MKTFTHRVKYESLFPLVLMIVEKTIAEEAGCSEGLIQAYSYKVKWKTDVVEKFAPATGITASKGVNRA